MIYVAIGIILFVVVGSLIYRPVICHVCDGAMHNVGPGKVYCPKCNREGHV